MIAIPIGLGLAYLIWGRKKEEPSTEESAEDTSITTQFMPMSQNITPAQARAMGFAAPAPAPKVPFMVQAAKRARVQDKMTMRASIGPGKPAGEPPAVKAAREAAAAAAKLGTPWPFKGGGAAPSPTPDIASWSSGAGASFDITTKLK